MNQTGSDPWDSADNPQVRQAEFWGQVQMDMYYAVLQKGVGKVPFDAAQHSVDKRVTAIEIKILPLPECNVAYDVSRGLIAESREWAGTVLASIKALGLTARELNGKYARVRYKPTGQTYVNAQGETKDRTTFEFVQVFGDEAACRADYSAQGGSVPAEDPNGHGPAVGPNQTVVTERETALKFLTVVVENACRGQSDLTVINNTIATNITAMPLINKFYTVDSPEVINLVMTKMGGK